MNLKLHNLTYTTEEKRSLALEAAARVATVPGIVMVAPPQVSLFAFHLRWPGSSLVKENTATQLLVERVNLRNRVMLSGAVVEGRFLARVCVLSFRTRARHMEACVTVSAPRVSVSCWRRWRSSAAAMAL